MSITVMFCEFMCICYACFWVRSGHPLVRATVGVPGGMLQMICEFVWFLAAWRGVETSMLVHCFMLSIQDFLYLPCSYPSQWCLVELSLPGCHAIWCGHALTAVSRGSCLPAMMWFAARHSRWSYIFVGDVEDPPEAFHFKSLNVLLCLSCQGPSLPSIQSNSCHKDFVELDLCVTTSLI